MFFFESAILVSRRGKWIRQRRRPRCFITWCHGLECRSIPIATLHNVDVGMQHGGLDHRARPHDNISECSDEQQAAGTTSDRHGDDESGARRPVGGPPSPVLVSSSIVRPLTTSTSSVSRRFEYVSN